MSFHKLREKIRWCLEDFTTFLLKRLLVLRIENKLRMLEIYVLKFLTMDSVQFDFFIIITLTLNI